jgi:hypothetical protein
MEQVDPKYLAQASGPANNWTPGTMPLRRFRVAPGEVQAYIQHLMTDDWNALGVRGCYPTFQIVDNVGEHWADVTVRGNVMEVDASPSRRAARPDVAEAVFWIRFGTSLFRTCNVTEV